MKFLTGIFSVVAIAASVATLFTVSASAQAPATGPIRIGSTLALTGPLATTALTHKMVGEIYIEQLNARGGLLGRKVEWLLKDDQSKPELARTLYEQLITSDKVDLLMGPYATGAILSAMGVAERYNKVLVHHTFGILDACSNRAKVTVAKVPLQVQHLLQAPLLGDLTTALRQKVNRRELAGHNRDGFGRLGRSRQCIKQRVGDGSARV